MPRLTRLSRSIAGRTALVTGAASGMGRATAQLFADEGARVGGRRSRRGGCGARGRRDRKAGGEAAGFALDVSDTAEPARDALRSRERLGPIDILINNAGIVAGGAIDAADFPAQWERALAINLGAQVHLIRACLDQLTRNGEGRIVNIASTEGWRDRADEPVHREQTRRGRPHTLARGRARGERRDGELHLPGSIHTGMTAVIPTTRRRSSRDAACPRAATETRRRWRT